MKKSKFTDSQIMEALKRVEAGLSVPEICRELGISSATRTAGIRRCMPRSGSKLKSSTRPSQKSGEAISPMRDGQTGSGTAWDLHTAGL